MPTDINITLRCYLVPQRIRTGSTKNEKNQFSEKRKSLQLEKAFRCQRNPRNMKKTRASSTTLVKGSKTAFCLHGSRSKGETRTAFKLWQQTHKATGRCDEQQQKCTEKHTQPKEKQQNQIWRRIEGARIGKKSWFCVSQRKTQTKATNKSQ